MRGRIATSRSWAGEFSTGMGCRGLAVITDGLTDDGLTSARGGGLVGTLSQMLANPAITGQRFYKGVAMKDDSGVLLIDRHLQVLSREQSPSNSHHPAYSLSSPCSASVVTKQHGRSQGSCGWCQGIGGSEHAERRRTIRCHRHCNRTRDAAIRTPPEGFPRPRSPKEFRDIPRPP